MLIFMSIWMNRKTLMGNFLPEKEKLYSSLNIEAITDADFMHVKRVCKDSEIKKLVEYHNFYLKIDTLLLADVFENFREMCL